MSFDRVAPYYDGLARLVFGRSIQRAQCYFLDQIPPTAWVLVVGGGTGWLLPYLLERPEVIHVTYLEASAAMLRQAQQKIRHLDPQRIAIAEFVHGDERSLKENDRFSVVITNFVLDMYEGAALDTLMRRLADQLTPEGRWLFTDFRLSARKKHRWWQRLATRAMYIFFHIAAGIAQQSLPPYDEHFRAHGFRMTHERAFFRDFIVSRVYQKDEYAK